VNELLADDVAIRRIDLLVIILNLADILKSLLLIEIERLLIRRLDVQIHVSDVGMTLSILKDLTEELGTCRGGNKTGRGEGNGRVSAVTMPQSRGVRSMRMRSSVSFDNVFRYLNMEKRVIRCKSCPPHRTPLVLNDEIHGYSSALPKGIGGECGGVLVSRPG
jgi:hypothetical protein